MVISSYKETIFLCNREAINKIYGTILKFILLINVKLTQVLFLNHFFCNKNRIMFA
jgi:hypothetical protein